MSTELAEIKVSDPVEQALVVGDLSALNPSQRVEYVRAVCRSTGLNPLTRPFDYIILNGKLTLYARRDATDQLRKLHGVSVTKVERQQMGDLLTVITHVAMPDGRTDQAFAAVPTANLKGEALAIAMMKCDTKSKRRATLSICGLGFLDESELEDAGDPGPRKKRQPEAPALPQSNPWDRAKTEPAPSPREELHRRVMDAMQADDITDNQLDLQLAPRYKDSPKIRFTKWQDLPDPHIAALLAPDKWAVLVANINTDPLS